MSFRKLLERYPKNKNLVANIEPEALLAKKYCEAVKTRSELSGRVGEFLIPLVGEDGEIKPAFDPLRIKEVEAITNQIALANLSVQYYKGRIDKVDSFLEQLSNSDEWRDEGEISCRRLRARMINLEDKASSRRALPQEVEKIQVEYERLKIVYEQLLNLLRLVPVEEKEMMKG